MDIVVDDLSDEDIVFFLASHVSEMRAHSPQDSMHALDLAELRKPDITFWSARDGEALVGCGALKDLGPDHAELKSMRTAPDRQRSGIASKLLVHIITEAYRKGYRRLSLETGAGAFFAPARALYAKFGFENCPPFADYVEDPHSVFMTRPL